MPHLLLHRRRRLRRGATKETARPASDRSALRLQAIGSLLDLGQDLLHEHLSLGDPVGTGPQDLANDIEDDLYSDDVPSLDCRNTCSLTAVT